MKKLMVIGFCVVAVILGAVAFSNMRQKAPPSASVAPVALVAPLDELPLKPVIAIAEEESNSMPVTPSAPKSDDSFMLVEGKGSVSYTEGPVIESESIEVVVDAEVVEVVEAPRASPGEVYALGNRDGHEELEKMRVRLDYAMEQIATFMLDRDRVFGMDDRLIAMEGKLSEMVESNKELSLELTRLENTDGVLLARIKAAEGKMALYEKQGYIPTQDVPLTVQEDFRLVGGVRYPMSPEVARKFMKSIQSLIPTELVRKQGYRAEMTDVYNSLQNELTQVNFLTQFVALAEAGENVHFMIGLPNPEKRPVWLELYSKGRITLCHPELDLTIFSNMDDRSELPSIFKVPAFGITYEGGVLQFYELRPI